jgi:hypothetical protein
VLYKRSHGWRWDHLRSDRRAAVANRARDRDACRREETRDTDTLILDAVKAKEAKGAAYARGKTLIVFLDAGLGEWKPNAVTRKLPPGHFKNVWVVSVNGLVERGRYTYGVTCIRTGLNPAGNAPIWLVQIHEAFEFWEVERIQ